MFFKHIAIAAVIAGAACCAQAGVWTQASSLKDLPAGVRQGLTSHIAGVIADHGEPFNSTCGVDNRPGKRFLVGAVSDEQVLVAYEHGGRGHGARVVTFQHQGDAWVKAGERSANGFPATMETLLAQASAN